MYNGLILVLFSVALQPKSGLGRLVLRFLEHTHTHTHMTPLNERSVRRRDCFLGNNNNNNKQKN